MKMVEAFAVMYGSNDGFMVSFEWIEGSILRSDHFPDKSAGEELIKTKDEAWGFANMFALKTFNRAVNIHVIDVNFSSIDEECIKNR